MLGVGLDSFPSTIYEPKCYSLFFLFGFPSAATVWAGTISEIWSGEQLIRFQHGTRPCIYDFMSSLEGPNRRENHRPIHPLSSGIVSLSLMCFACHAPHSPFLFTPRPLLHPPLWKSSRGISSFLPDGTLPRPSSLRYHSCSRDDLGNLYFTHTFFPGTKQTLILALVYKICSAGSHCWESYRAPIVSCDVVNCSRKRNT